MSSRSRVRVLVVGGGVVGLSIAHALAKRRLDLDILVLDSGPVGRSASWAGAGMIAPLSERLPEDPVCRLRAVSAALYAEWSEALRDETGLDNGYRRCGGVDVALDEREATELRAMAGRWRVEGVVHEHLARADHRRVEPALTPDAVDVWFLPDRAQIRNPRHLRALETACRNRGVRFLEHAPARGWITRESPDGRGLEIQAVQLDDAPMPCEIAVLAAGAWSGELLASLGLHAPTPPLKGQIVLLRGEPGRLRRIVEHGKHYLVPRDDGRVLVGATEEEVGFDCEPTDDARAALLDEAFRLCPGLADLSVERVWAGLRPGSVDTRPYIGRPPGFANLIVASGHKRAGLQLAPGTAEIVADLIENKPPMIDLSHFLPGRAPRSFDEGSIRS